MQIHFLCDINEWDELSEPWNRLVDVSATSTPFQRHEYLRIWWETRGGGEWENGEIFVGVGFTETGELLGIAPFVLTEDEEGLKRLMFLGSVEISDYLDCIVESSRSQEFIEGLIASLESEKSQDWDVMDMYNIPEASPSLKNFSESAQLRGWKVTRERLQPCPYIPLEGSWEGYLQNIDSKQRRELRRKIRRAESYPAQVSWRISTSQEIEGDLERFIELMSLDPHKAEFLTDRMRDQFRRFVMSAWPYGWIQLALLEAGGELACGYINFDFKDRLWIYNSGVNPEYLQLSPGWVLMGYLIQWANENGRSEVDFLRGDEEYKYRLGGIDRFIDRLIISRS